MLFGGTQLRHAVAVAAVATVIRTCKHSTQDSDQHTGCAVSGVHTVELANVSEHPTMVAFAQYTAALAADNSIVALQRTDYSCVGDACSSSM
jgi:hypothetical protein